MIVKVVVFRRRKERYAVGELAIFFPAGENSSLHLGK